MKAEPEAWSPEKTKARPRLCGVPELFRDNPFVDPLCLQQPYNCSLCTVHRHHILKKDPIDEQVEVPVWSQFIIYLLCK